MQHPIRPARQAYAVMFWMGDDLGVYRRMVEAHSHPEAVYRAVSKANDGGVNSVVRKKAFKAVSMTSIDDVESFEGPLHGISMLDGVVRGPLTKAEEAAAKEAAR